MIVVLVLALVTVVFAHDTWMLADAPSGSTVTFSVTSGMDFPELDSGPSQDRVAGSGWRLGSQTGDFEMEDGDDALLLNADIEGTGTAVGWIAFNPKEVDLTTEDAAEYLDEVGAPESLRRTWASMGPGQAWHETYTKYAKAFVRVGDGDDDPTCIPALGAAIELIPVVDPTGLSEGDSIVVRVLKKGYQVNGQAVAAVCGANGEVVMKYSNKSGHVSFQIDSSGPWLIRATELRLQPDGSWFSDFTTMTFTVED
jgi:uncharacterized GH25 family protein